MPEGPEVRREADIISSALTGKVIKKIWAEYPELHKNILRFSFSPFHSWYKKVKPPENSPKW